MQIDCFRSCLCRVVAGDLVFCGEACKLLVYLPCAAVVATVWRRRWYAVWMKGQRCNHVLLVSTLLSQSSMSGVFIPQRVRRSMAFINNCLYVYGTFAMIAIFWQSAHLLNNSLGGSCGLSGAKKLRLFWCIASGVGLPYITIN